MFEAPPTHNGRAMVSGEVSENPLDVIAARYPQLSYHDVEDIFQHFDETMSSGDQMMAGSLAKAIAENNLKWILSIGKMLAILENYTSKQREPHFKQMSIATMAYVLGFKEQAGVQSFAEIARKHLRSMKNKGSGKATAQKCGDVFIEKLKLAPMLTQRTEAARKEMTNARLEQIHKHNL